ncbi:MAG TPA: gamma-glutamyltransferase [Opitutaceae bacterium]|nr:gamma-glutamyltransferase [Opitutaceae bacterium]
MRFLRPFCSLGLAVVVLATVLRAAPVAISSGTFRHGVVVAGHPQAAAVGLAVLRQGGNAIDAAVATSLALGVAEPYASGLGGKVMLLYYEAAQRRVFAVDGMDAAGSVDVAAFSRRPAEDRSYGYGAVAVPGLPAGLWLAHQRWGRRPWADDVAPAVDLAERGFTVLPKSRQFFEEQVRKLRRGDREIARLYLPGGKLPEIGAVLPNPDLARSLTLLATHGRDGFYRGPVAEAIVAACAAGQGSLTAGDLATYEARVTEPVEISFHGLEVVSAPPPTNGSAMLLPALKALEEDPLPEGSLRRADVLDRLGRIWRQVEPESYRVIGDAPESRFKLERLLAPGAIDDLRRKAGVAVPAPVSAWMPLNEEAVASTTHFIVVDAAGNVVCATQSLSVHFGAGVVAPGTGIVLNNSMSNFEYGDRTHPNALAPGRRPRSTICPTLVLKEGKPLLALGVPGSARIPTSLFQVLLDRLVLGRPLAEAIGDTRFHFEIPWRKGDVQAVEAEQSLPAGEAEGLRRLGWKVNLSEPAGEGRKFSGVSAVEFNPDGTVTGYADPRRSNAVAGD